MDSGFHFASPWWLLALLVPLLVWLWPNTRRRVDDRSRLAHYADAALLPHLMIEGSPSGENRRRRFLRWAAIWSLGVIAMAGPRWDFTEVKLFQPGVDLVILLDLSTSMKVSDVSPSRLARARQEIGDLLDLNSGVRIGLIAFASVAHVVTPITDDIHALRHTLPFLTSDLVGLPGSRPEAAIDKAVSLLRGQPSGNSRSILLISDGDFADPKLQQQVEALRKEGIRLHTLGIGTLAGGRVNDIQGRPMLDKSGQLVNSSLDEQTLKALAKVGDGLYQQADFRNDDSRALIKAVLRDAPTQQSQSGARRVWSDHFFLLVLLMLLLMLPWFQRAGQAARRLPGEGS